MKKSICCSHCGTENIPNAAKCIKCGVNLIPPRKKATSSLYPAAILPGGKSAWVKGGLWLFVGLLILCFFGAGYFFSQESNFFGWIILSLPLFTTIIYYLRGWGKTYYGLWPDSENSVDDIDRECATCHSHISEGKVYKGLYLCDKCVYARYRELKPVPGCLSLFMGLAGLYQSISVLYFGEEIGRSEVPIGEGRILVTEYPLMNSPLVNIIIGVISLIFVLGAIVFFIRPIKEKDMRDTGNAIASQLLGP
ncbi:MAG: hypothetical protein ACXADH_06085 [Candidatus Kariarchaeaceae archaeon]|jgi:hypothetical protein